MVLLLVLSFVIMSVLDRKYPLTDDNLASKEDLIAYLLLIPVLIQPLLLPQIGIVFPPDWWVLTGFLITGLGLVGLIIAKRTLGSSSANVVIPRDGYVTSGVYQYLRHPMYISFVLILGGVAVIGTSIVSVAVLFLVIGIYIHKARQENLLRASVEGKTSERVQPRTL
jgi:protein-S-isoprenylcysteine O-methyltransferase Ste14